MFNYELKVFSSVADSRFITEHSSKSFLEKKIMMQEQRDLFKVDYIKSLKAIHVHAKLKCDYNFLVELLSTFDKDCIIFDAAVPPKADASKFNYITQTVLDELNFLQERKSYERSKALCPRGFKIDVFLNLSYADMLYSRYNKELRELIARLVEYPIKLI